MKRSEEEVDKMIEDMMKRTKGNYITQGCAFNKNCPRQMNILKNSLMSSNSFSGLVKEVLAINFGGGMETSPSFRSNNEYSQPKTKSVEGWI